MTDEKMKILIVDDEFYPGSSGAEGAMVMRDYARELGIDLCFAYSACEGIEAYIKENPDVVITDMSMEKYDSGISVIENIREQDTQTLIYVNSNTDDSSLLKRLSKMRRDGMYDGWVGKVLCTIDFEKLIEEYTTRKR